MDSVEIREDLRMIRYYYARKKVFDNAQLNVGENQFSDIINKYNEAIRSADPRLYDLYVSLYVENNTQESLADKFGFCIEYISRLNTKLVRYLGKYFKEKEKNKTQTQL